MVWMTLLLCTALALYCTKGLDSTVLVVTFNSCSYCLLYSLDPFMPTFKFNDHFQFTTVLGRAHPG